MNKSVFDDHANECTVVIIPATKKLTSPRGGGGGGAGEHSLMRPMRGRAA